MQPKTYLSKKFYTSAPTRETRSARNIQTEQAVRSLKYCVPLALYGYAYPSPAKAWTALTAAYISSGGIPAISLKWIK